ncbi:hypothetical protein GQX73_g5405 [Xylaria multiplex]|uniref:Uncharacterized protein n=1 Tax=Xylaria multiplex TaxID=323545 RepID=A0A7C8IUC9_9PEZI|nr:hypothetical protein GQX73_g5405 [Xylaria multiplex]
MEGKENTAGGVDRPDERFPLKEDGFVACVRQNCDQQQLQQLSIATTSGDTLIIVRFPAGDSSDCKGNKWETKVFLMKSGQLLATGSSVFIKRLSPEVQAQTRRRLKGEYQSYKYVLDLTPQMEGENSASEVAELSLSRGVRDWWYSHYTLDVSKQLVYGHDDNCIDHLSALVSEDIVSEGKNTLSVPRSVSNVRNAWRKNILDYCPIRHRVAILRLLEAISSGNLCLNSAPRIATMAVIAKHFDCVKVVKSHILTWLSEKPNQNFIEINPEDALKYGWMLELPTIVRTAFVVLVVERAIEVLDGQKVGIGIHNKGPQSIFGRPRGSITDEQQNCIEHAAHKLVQRTEELWDRLLSDKVHKYLSITTWPRNGKYERELRAHIHGIIRYAASTKDVEFNQTIMENDRNRALYVAANDLVPMKEIYADLSPTQRLLTTCFWRSLSNFASERSPPEPPFSEASSEFSTGAVCRQFVAGIYSISSTWSWLNVEVDIDRTGPLVLGLSDEEFTFLPTWAGGQDDGTGRVYQADIPDALDKVPIGPGPSFCTGETIPDDRSTTVGGDTVSTGDRTVTMTNGYSIEAVFSQTNGTAHEDAEGATLIAATDGLSLTIEFPRSPTVTPDLQEDPAGLTPVVSESGFDWMVDGSERQDLGDLDNSDVDTDAPDDTDDNDASTNGAGYIENANYPNKKRPFDQYTATM